MLESSSPQEVQKIMKKPYFAVGLTTIIVLGIASLSTGQQIASPQPVAQKVRKAETPSKVVIENALKKQFTNNDYATRQYKLTVISIQRGAPREGNSWSDGTPANVKTRVFPCKVVWIRVTTYTTGDTEVVKEKFTGEYVFFLDEYGEWTFRLKKQESKKL